jgi:hypothetical protein
VAAQVDARCEQHDRGGDESEVTRHASRAW